MSQERGVLLIDDEVAAKYERPDYGLDTFIRDLLDATVSPQIVLTVARNERDACEKLSALQFDAIILNFYLRTAQEIHPSALLYVRGKGRGEGGEILSRLKRDPKLAINHNTPVIGFSELWCEVDVRLRYPVSELYAHHSKPIADLAQFIRQLRDILLT